MSPLNELLGLPPTSRVLIIAADGLGMCHATTEGVYHSLRSGVATTGRLMVPAPWAREAAAQFRGEDVGVSLTVTAEYDRYRWGPITRGPSLVDGNGGFPSTSPDFWDHADIAETRSECRAQIERAIWWGFDVSHLDTHCDTLHLRPEFFDIELELAVEFAIPLRLPSSADETRAGFPFRRLAHEENVVTPDSILDVGSTTMSGFEVILENLAVGVTELRMTPGIDTPELRALDEEAELAIAHHELLTNADIRDMISRHGVTLVGYRELRTAQRAIAAR